MFRRGDDIGKVRYYTLEDVRPWIAPILPKALHLFRKGTNICGETNYVAADSVPDDYLTAAFAYVSVVAELKEKKEEYRSHEAAIYEFRPETADESERIQNTKPIDRYIIEKRQIIRRIKPEELRCFK